VSSRGASSGDETTSCHWRRLGRPGVFLAKKSAVIRRIRPIRFSFPPPGSPLSTAEDVPGVLRETRASLRLVSCLCLPQLISCSSPLTGASLQTAEVLQGALFPVLETAGDYDDFIVPMSAIGPDTVGLTISEAHRNLRLLGNKSTSPRVPCVRSSVRGDLDDRHHVRPTRTN